MYRNAKTKETETITATKSGYITIYCAKQYHLAYLEELAQELGIVLYDPENDFALPSFRRECIS